MDRRDFLRHGAAGALALLAPGTLARPAAAAEAFCRIPLGGAQKTLAGTQPAQSSAAFTQPLRIPPVARPVRRDAVADHYEIVMRQAPAELVAATTTTIWGYDGIFPGPTILARVGRPVIVRQFNRLDVDTAVHLHGGRVAPEHDGHPVDFIAPGTFRDYHYPNEQGAATLWYHDHAMHATAENVYRGLAGLYLLRDDAEDALGLPSGPRDVPLVLADRSFAEDGSLRYERGAHGGFFGEVVLVNGTPQPYLRVERRAYRFRILNASNARSYRLAFANGSALVVVAGDGGLLPRPVRLPVLEVAPAERYEIVVDFSAHGPGAQIVLEDAAMGGLVRFDVADTEASSSPLPQPLPQRLNDIPALPPARVTREITLDFDQASGVWLLNGHGFDPHQYDAFPRLGSVETWRLTNDTHMAHPMHLHLVMFQILARHPRGQARTVPPPHERGWKDTVRIEPGETVELAASFDGYTGRYVYHCHILEHEDHDMMSQFRVVDLQRLAGPGRVETAVALSAASFTPPVPVAFVAGAGGFADALSAGPAAAAGGGPLLLTAADSLHPATADELRRLQPQRIVVVGGPSAVGDSVLAELRSWTDGTVERVAGQSRDATAAAVSAATFAPGVDAAWLATGADFPDALAAGPAAAAAGGPLLLVAPDQLPDVTAQELHRLRPARIFVAGGARAVSDAVVEKLRSFAPRVERVSGASRYDTAAAVSRTAFAGTGGVVYVATGAAFADALAAVPVAGTQGAPLLLVAGDHVPSAVDVELRRLAPRRIVVVGGDAAVSGAVERALSAYL